ncbi:MAG: hypothetical protein V3R52_00060, partial [Candidatus Neomarinimicrobiota bacterium]
SISDKSANITFSANSDANFQVKFKWEHLINTDPQRLYVLPEATALVAIGETPNHMLSIIEDQNRIKINGHSVMLGYIDTIANDTVFKSGGLVTSK